jgi:hypothetical protein
MRCSPSHYTIAGRWVKSWRIESSLDGETWSLLDQRMDTQDFARYDYHAVDDTASFAVANTTESRFIRLVQLDNGDNCEDGLNLRGVEFFGTLSESIRSRLTSIEGKLDVGSLNIRLPLRDAESLEGLLHYLLKKEVETCMI